MTPEKSIENQIRHQFKKAGGYIVKFFASPNTNKGVPDLLGCLNGHFYALEIKRKHGGKPTPVQIDNLQQIANAGGYGFVTNDKNLIKVIKNIKPTQHPKSVTSNNSNIVINHFSQNNGQLTPQQAKQIWQQTKNFHSLQIVKNHR